MPNYRRAAIPGGTYFFTLVTYRRQKILCHENIRAALRDAINTTRTKLPFTIDAMVLLPDHLHAIWTLPENDHAYSARWSMIKRLVTQRVGGVVGAHGAPYVMPSAGVAGAHGAPYGNRGDGVVGCAVRTDITAGRDDGAVGCAVRTDINTGRGDDFVGCAARTDINYENGGGDDFVGCAVRTDNSHAAPVSQSRKKRREGTIWQRRFWEHRVRDQADLNRCLDYLHWNPVKHEIVSRVADWPYSTFHRYVREGVYAQDWGGQGIDDLGAFGE
jgi:REP element-mobilizing transposase RayT